MPFTQTESSLSNAFTCPVQSPCCHTQFNLESREAISHQTAVVHAETECFSKQHPLELCWYVKERKVAIMLFPNMSLLNLSLTLAKICKFFSRQLSALQWMLIPDQLCGLMGLLTQQALPPPPPPAPSTTSICIFPNCSWTTSLAAEWPL